MNVSTDGPTEANIDEQITFIDNYITQGVNGILFAANDPVAIAPVLKKALAAGIHVVGYDANSQPDAREWFVNQAEFNGIGKSMIDSMAAEIGEDGAFAIVTSTFTTPNQARWIAEMQAYQAACHPNMKWLETVEAQEDNTLSFNQATTLINKYGDELKGLFGMTSVATPASADAVTQARLCGKVAVVGLATPNAMKPYVKADCVKSVVLWNPVDLGYAAVQVLRAVVDGKLKAGRHGSRGRQARQAAGRQRLRDPARRAVRLHARRTSTTSTSRISARWHPSPLRGRVGVGGKMKPSAASFPLSVPLRKGEGTVPRDGEVRLQDAAQSRAWRRNTSAAMTSSGRNWWRSSKDAGISDYSIHLDDDTNILFGVLWRRDDHTMDALPNHPVMRRWWDAYARHHGNAGPTANRCDPADADVPHGLRCRADGRKPLPSRSRHLPTWEDSSATSPSSTSARPMPRSRWSPPRTPPSSHSAPTPTPPSRTASTRTSTSTRHLGFHLQPRLRS